MGDRNPQMRKSIFVCVWFKYKLVVTGYLTLLLLQNIDETGPIIEDRFLPRTYELATNRIDSST